MSYFSHHPEAWDLIERKGVAKKLASYHPDNDVDIVIDLEDIFAEMQNDTESKARCLWTMLTDWAHEEIHNEEQAYFEGFVP